MPVGPTPDGKPWTIWCPALVEHHEAKGTPTRLAETGYVLLGPRRQPRLLARLSPFQLATGGYLGKGFLVPQWKGVNEVALLRAANGDWVAACRTDIPARFKGETLDHYEGLGISISKDRGRTWSEVTKLYDWGRHHPSLVLMPNDDIVMTYVVRKGYVDTPDGYPQFGIEAVVSHDHGATWDLDHRYILDTWAGNRNGAQRLVGQQPSDVLGPLAGWFHSHGLRHGLPIATRPRQPSNPAGRRACALATGRSAVNGDRALRDAPFDSGCASVRPGKRCPAIAPVPPIHVRPVKIPAQNWTEASSPGSIRGGEKQTPKVSVVKQVTTRIQTK